MKFNGMHSVETILGLVGASLLIKVVERCSDRYCQNEEVHQVIHEAEEQVAEEIHHYEQPFEQNTFLHDTIYEVETNRTLSPRSNATTVYNLAVQPTKLLNHKLSP
jgi:hypothetical protein